MHVALIHRERVPPVTYGGTERAIFWLGRELIRRGHAVTLIAAAGSGMPGGTVKVLDFDAPLAPQIPADIDVVHFNFIPAISHQLSAISQPYVITNQGNLPPGMAVDRNVIFVSKNHAERHGSSVFVRNGLDPEAYGPVDFTKQREYVHFLGKAAWQRKNVKGAIAVARDAKIPLVVLGGTRLNFSMGFRLTLDPNVRFAGMVGGETKNRLINGSRGLVFPVTWHDPCPVAVIESLYYGCPVLGTPYGSLPELVPTDCGVLSTSRATLAEAARDLFPMGSKRAHEWVRDTLSVKLMTDNYLRLYERVRNGERLNPVEPMAKEAFSNQLEWTA